MVQLTWLKALIRLIAVELFLIWPSFLRQELEIYRRLKDIRPLAPIVFIPCCFIPWQRAWLTLNLLLDFDIVGL